MLTVTKCLPAGRGLAPVLLKRAATVQLDWDVRQKSRFDAVDSTGRRLGVFLPRGTVVRGGDVLVTEDGSMVRVEAAPQPVLEVRACPDHGSPYDLMRAAYHLGNRHVQLELRPDCLRLEPDHVLADMLRALHLRVAEVRTPFEPEAGAYAAGGHGHAHAHGHAHGPAHDHGHGHGHAHAPAASALQAHVHGHDYAATACAHDHAPGPSQAVGSCGYDHGAHPAHHQQAAHPGHDPHAGCGHDTARGHVHGPACGHAHGQPHDGRPGDGPAPR